MSKPAHYKFETPEQLYAWLQANHASETRQKRMAEMLAKLARGESP